MVDRVRDAKDLAIERVHRVGEQAMARTRRIAGAGRDRLERHGHHAGRQRLEGIGPRKTDQVEQRDPRHDPARRIQSVRDRLGAVGGGRHHHPAAGFGHDPLQDRATQTGALELGRDEQHREEPQPLAHVRRGERHDPFLAGLRLRLDRHDEPLRVTRREMAVQAEQRRGLRSDLDLAERQDVVVDRFAPDLGAARQFLVPHRSEGQPVERGHVSSTPIRCSSSAIMNGSRSPSRTPAVLLVS